MTKKIPIVRENEAFKPIGPECFGIQVTGENSIHIPGYALRDPNTIDFIRTKNIAEISSDLKPNNNSVSNEFAVIGDIKSLGLEELFEKSVGDIIKSQSVKRHECPLFYSL